jgi:hypothetical protein
MNTDPSTTASPEASPGTRPPVVCTLTTREMAGQKLEWTDIAAIALRRQRIKNGVTSYFALENAGAVEDLARREQSCCGSWLHIETSREGGELRLQLTSTNPDGLGIIMSMAGFDAP